MSGNGRQTGTNPIQGRITLQKITAKNIKSCEEADGEESDTMPFLIFIDPPTDSTPTLPVNILTRVFGALKPPSRFFYLFH